MIEDKVIGFVWQYIFLILSMFFMTFGVTLCVIIAQLSDATLMRILNS